ncbi:MAG: hypothetical protein M1368_10755 [Thaumarchaeota archaeon]|nr:hypothetical protein [Nitrososphaerota archaeon]
MLAMLPAFNVTFWEADEVVDTNPFCPVVPEDEEVLLLVLEDVLKLEDEKLLLLVIEVEEDVAVC